MSSAGSLHFLGHSGYWQSYFLMASALRSQVCAGCLQKPALRLVVHFIRPARAPLVQLSKRQPVYHGVIMGGAPCYLCHIPLAGRNKPKFYSLSSLFQGVSTKRQEPRTHGSDIRKLLQHTSSVHHHIPATVPAFHRSGRGGSSVKGRSQS